MITNKLVIASDHAGFPLKQKIITYLRDRHIEVKDLGTDSEQSVDYPDYAHALAAEIEAGNFNYGISICGSGNGINMTANKHQAIRSALCWTEEIARLARYHNDANICSMAGRFTTEECAYKIVDAFLTTDFEGGRHIQRVGKIPVKTI